MKHINHFAICNTLNFLSRDSESKMEGLICLLETSPELKDLLSVKNCLDVMRRICYEYGMNHASTYTITARLLFNLESLMMRLMSRSENPVRIECQKLNNILDKAAEFHHHRPRIEVAIGESAPMIGIGSRYFLYFLHMNYTEQEIANIKKNLASPDSCGLNFIASTQEINAIKKEMDNFQYIDIDPGIREAGSFRKLIYYLSREKNLTRRNIILEKPADILINVRNSVSHTGNMDLCGTSLLKVLEYTFLFMEKAADCSRKPKRRFVKAITFCAFNPFGGFKMLFPYLQILLYICIALIVLWTFSPPKPQEMNCNYVSYVDKLEELFEAFAKRDTVTAVKIHKETKIILETLEAIE